VGLGAIVVPGGRRRNAHDATGPSSRVLLSEPLAYLDVAGRSACDRFIERLVRSDVDVVSVVEAEAGSGKAKSCLAAFEKVEFQSAVDPYAAVQRTLQEYSRAGIEHSFLLFGSVYAETDLLDLFYFHREARQAATRTINREGELDLWVVDCLKAQDSDLHDLFLEPKKSGNSYFIREYVNRLIHPRDLRCLGYDLLQGRCTCRPSGREVKRGIWIDDEAEVHRGARVVPPAYIGRGSKIMQDTLITRHSTIEKNCCVDYGTVVEDSSVLQNTDIGICLDVCHAVASGNKLWSLDRDVVIEISDAAVMRSNDALHKPVKTRTWARNALLFGRRKRMHRTTTELRPAASAPEQRGLETNFYEGVSKDV
jgi:carbonic anhydrase/acetyltransferase-like protein (isoleucine patch superfamily)